MKLRHPNIVQILDFGESDGRHYIIMEYVEGANLRDFLRIRSRMTAEEALPLMLGWGEGSELRRPLGVSIFGGLIVSQLLTLFTTPVIYLWFDRLQRRLGGRSSDARPDHPPSGPEPSGAPG